MVKFALEAIVKLLLHAHLIAAPLEQFAKLAPVSLGFLRARKQILAQLAKFAMLGPAESQHVPTLLVQTLLTPVSLESAIENTTLSVAQRSREC